MVGNLIDQFNLLKEKDQEEIRSLVKEKLEDTLINILDFLGFEGVDISLNLSLFAYGVVYNSDTKKVILSINREKFDMGEITDEDIESDIKNMGEGFFSYVDMSRSEYLDFFRNSSNRAKIIKDFIDFGGSLSLEGFSYNFNLVDLVRKVRGLLK